MLERFTREIDRVELKLRELRALATAKLVSDGIDFWVIDQMFDGLTEAEKAVNKSIVRLEHKMKKGKA